MESQFLNESVPDGPVGRFQEPSPQAEGATEDTIVEDYLDHLCAPLVGRIGYAERQELRAEVREHIESLIAAYTELWGTRGESIRDALRQFGSPSRLGQQWARTWKSGSLSHLSSSSWRATFAGLGWFSAALLFTVSFFVVRGLAFHTTWFNVGDFEVPLVSTVMPLAAGLLTGLTARGRQALGALYGASFAIMVSTLVAARLDDVGLKESFISLAFVQFLSWIPVGCLGAAVGGWLRRKIESLRAREWALE